MRIVCAIYELFFVGSSAKSYTLLGLLDCANIGLTPYSTAVLVVPASDVFCVLRLGVLVARRFPPLYIGVMPSAVVSCGGCLNDKSLF